MASSQVTALNKPTTVGHHYVLKLTDLDPRHMMNFTMTNNYQHLFLTLTNKNLEEMTLQYNIRQNEVAQIWARCVEQALPYGIYEDDRLYNWQLRSSQDEIVILLRKLDQLTTELEALHPEIKFPKIDSEQL